MKPTVGFRQARWLVKTPAPHDWDEEKNRHCCFTAARKVREGFTKTARMWPTSEFRTFNYGFYTVIKGNRPRMLMWKHGLSMCCRCFKCSLNATLPCQPVPVLQCVIWTNWFLTFLKNKNLNVHTIIEKWSLCHLHWKQQGFLKDFFFFLLGQEIERENAPAGNQKQQGLRKSFCLDGAKSSHSTRYEPQRIADSGDCHQNLPRPFRTLKQPSC